MRKENVFLSLVTIAAFACHSHNEQWTKNILSSNIDKTVLAQNNFFDYAKGA